METADSPLVGKPAPAVAGTTFTGGSASLASMHGRWVLVNFFASWCEACQTEEPQLEQFLYSRHAGEHPAVLGVLYGDSLADGKSFQRQEGATWPSLVDSQAIVDYGVGALPRSFLVDPQGRVVASIVGSVTSAGLDQLIAAAGPAAGSQAGG
jgi:cytochrome c biogenesis protein CcmG/thiol:disulfide interchange protein DsbE